METMFVGVSKTISNHIPSCRISNAYKKNTHKVSLIPIGRNCECNSNTLLQCATSNTPSQCHDVQELPESLQPPIQPPNHSHQLTSTTESMIPVSLFSNNSIVTVRSNTDADSEEQGRANSFCWHSRIPLN